MKIIQSFWSKPSFSKTEGNDNRSMGGWSDTKYYYMSWSLSCLRLMEYYDEVELYTDKLGKELLVDILNLPFTKVHLSLNRLKAHNPYLWTLGKIYVYNSQKEPFLHIDSDIFVWEPFNKEFLNRRVVAQNLENNQTYYKPIVQELLHSFSLPRWLREFTLGQEKILAANTGIFGGFDHEFIRFYSSTALKIINNNLNNMNRVNMGAYSVTIEQYLLYAAAAKNRIPIEYFIYEDLDYSKLTSIVKIYGTPSRIKYIHPLATYKKLSLVYNAVELSLRLEFPKIYYRLMRLFANYRL